MKGWHWGLLLTAAGVGVAVWYFWPKQNTQADQRATGFGAGIASQLASLMGGGPGAAVVGGGSKFL